MKAIILAAGRGRRLQQLTKDRPKCLIELRGRSLLDWQLAALHQAGVVDIALATGYRNDLLRNRGFPEFYNPRWEHTNMVMSLACADDWLKAGPCIVSYSDIFFSASAPASLMRTDAALAITYDPNWRLLWERRFSDPLSDAETFRLRPDGAVAEIGGKPDRIAAIKGQYMGLLLFTPKGWHEVQRICATLRPNERDQLHMTKLLQHVVDAGVINVQAVPYTGFWGEIDTINDLNLYERENVPPHSWA